MAIRRVPAPIGDPFWDTVKARHPDIDVLLLPPEPPPPAVVADPPAADEETLALLRDALADTVRRVLAEAVPAAVLPPVDDDCLSAPEPDAVRVRAQVVLRVEPDGDVPDLDRAGQALRADGWTVRRREGVVTRLVGDHDLAVGPGRLHLDLVTTWAPGTGVLQTEVTSRPVAVGAATARALLAARRGGGA